eukprot:gb/GECG01001397.1/.p1 GENE.gb/GECG01001397.1/~~gb/GECG01001397.1/.p1  ORF type:complete len:897 (+),score=140.83 gb/GECG01001397.1/:1-2691(+)
MNGEVQTMGKSPPSSLKHNDISPPPPPSRQSDGDGESKASTDSSNNNQPVVFEWLKRIGLADCIDSFKARSVDTPQALAALTYDDYDALGVTNVADRRRLFELVTRVRQAAEHHRATPEKSFNNKSTEASTPEEDVNNDISFNDTCDSFKQIGSPRGDDASEDEHKGEEGDDESNILDKVAERIPADALEGVTSSQNRSLVRAFAKDLHQAGVISSVLQQPAKIPEFFKAWLETRDKVSRRSSGREGASDPMDGAYDDVDTEEENDENVLEIPRQNAGGKQRKAPGQQQSSDHPPPRSSAFEHPAERSKETSRAPAAQSGQQKRAPSAEEDPAARVDYLQKMSTEDDTRIKVLVRKRPLSKVEKKDSDIDIVQSVSKRTLLVHEPKLSVDLTASSDQHTFTFDDAFDHTCDTKQIYEQAAAPLVGSLLQGARVACFAYGQTGSGKTFTMMGDPNNPYKQPGVYLLAAKDIFAAIKSPQFASKKFVVRVSLYEIYGSKLYDLLNDRRELKALEDHAGAVVIKGLQSFEVHSVEELIDAMKQGLNSRAVGVTGANSDSSRSHAVLKISLWDTRRGRDPDRGAKLYSNFSFIDLAGSERGADTTTSDKRTRLEGAEINKSLLALKECIRSLHQESSHLPFRGSKLTQVLKDSFVGNSRSVMIATISPNMANCEHTLNTLRYAYRVKEISTESVENGDALVAPHGCAYLDKDHVDPNTKAQQVAEKAADTSKHRRRGKEARERAEARMQAAHKKQVGGNNAQEKSDSPAQKQRPFKESDVEPEDNTSHRRVRSADKKRTKEKPGKNKRHPSAGPPEESRSSDEQPVRLTKDDDAILRVHRQRMEELMNLLKEETTLSYRVRTMGMANFADEVESYLDAKSDIIERFRDQLRGYKEKAGLD